MNERANVAFADRDRWSDGDGALERAVLECVLSRRWRVLHVAPSERLGETLGEIEQLDYCVVEDAGGDGDLPTLGYVDETFDLLVDEASPEGLPLDEVARLLRPGGRAVLVAEEGGFVGAAASVGLFAVRAEGDVYVCARSERG